MKHRIARLISTVIALMSLLGGHAAFAQTGIAGTGMANLSYVGTSFVASNYNWPANGIIIGTGNASTGSSTIVLRAGYVRLQDHRAVSPFQVGSPITINDASQETVTPTAVSGCNKTQGMNQDLP